VALNRGSLFLCL